MLCRSGRAGSQFLLFSALLCLARPVFVFGQAAQPVHGDQASLQSFQIPSHGFLLNAFMYVAAGAAPHPVVVLLHGFPGNERNLDIAQDIRRAGWDVLYFDYRGSWESPGAFSFSHGIKDTAAAIAYLKTPRVSSLLKIDTTHIVLLGHSAGGFMAVEDGAEDSSVLAVGLISPTDLGGRIPERLSKAQKDAALVGPCRGYASEGMAPLAGCTPESLAEDTITNASIWRFDNKAESLKTRPVLVISSDDGLASANASFVAALRSKGNERVTELHLNTDHSYSDKRSELSSAVLHWLKELSR